MGDYEAWIDLAVLDQLHERCDVGLDIGLPRFHREALGDEGTHHEFIHTSNINSGHRQVPAFAYAPNDVPQHVCAICSEKCVSLDIIDDGIQCAMRCRLGSDRIDACVGSAALGHLHQCRIDGIDLGEIDCLRTAGLGHAQPFRNFIDGDDALRAQEQR